MRKNHSNMVNHFFKYAGLSFGTFLLSTNFAAAHKTPPINFNPEILCGNANKLHGGKSDCYGIFAKQMTRYAEQSASQYLNAKTTDHVTDLLRQDNPSSIEIDHKKQIIYAFWLNSDQQFHHEHKPAYLKIDLKRKTYTELWYRNGIFFRSGNLPTFMKVTNDKKIKIQWNTGSHPKIKIHNDSGPAYAHNEITKSKLTLKWALKGIPANPIDPKGGPTRAEIDLTTNVATFHEYSSGDGDAQHRMHRHDCVHTQKRDARTGKLLKIVYHYHDRDPSTNDEIEVAIFFNPRTEKPIKVNWTKNGEKITPPKSFQLPENHYCGDPGHSHPAAKYK